jgi:hypothetical protein
LIAGFGDYAPNVNLHRVAGTPFQLHGRVNSPNAEPSTFGRREPRPRKDTNASTFFATP